MNYLGDPYGCIIDVQASDFEKGIVAGTGPYVVTDMQTDHHLTLTKNDNYWNGTPKIDTLTIRTLSDGDTLSAALLAGDIDAAYGMAYESYPNFENNGFQFSSIQTSRAFFASMNLPWGSTRKALSRHCWKDTVPPATVLSPTDSVPSAERM